MQGVGEATVADGEGSGAQRLRRDLAAVEAGAGDAVIAVAATEEVAVELLEVEEGHQVGDVAVLQLVHRRSPPPLATS